MGLFPGVGCGGISVAFLFDGILGDCGIAGVAMVAHRRNSTLAQEAVGFGASSSLAIFAQVTIYESCIDEYIKLRILDYRTI